MGTVEVDSIAEYVRFTVGNIFPGWEIWIICLFFDGFIYFGNVFLEEIIKG